MPDSRRFQRLSGSVLYALVGAAALVASSGTAAAQNALGNGTALDNSLGSGGRTNYQRPSFAQELQFRNAVVTGNAPGGLSFRGDLGYRAAGEFAGSLGSDGLFSFRRDSLYSGLAGMGIRGTDALQYQFSLTTGSRPPSNLVGDLSVARDRVYQPSAPQGGLNQPGTIGFDPGSTDTRGLNLYRPSVQESELSDAMTGTLRSAATYSTTTNLSPVVMSVFEEGIERNQYGLTASPLTGVTASPMKSAATGTLDRDRGAENEPVVPAKSAYQEVVERLRARAEAQATAAGETMENDNSIVEQIAKLRMGMMGADPAALNGEQPETDASGNPNPGQSTDPNTGVDPNMNTGIDPANGPSAVNQPTPNVVTGETDIEGQPSLFQLDESTLDLIRDSGAPISALIDPNAETRDLYSEHMRTGERLIQTERYFDAEERFARALAIKPGDQSAQIGRVHAQIGAGLVLSGAVNLRSILLTYPELLGTRYTGALLPAPERVDVLIEVLSERAGVIRREGEGLESIGVRRSAALLLAYLGFQNERDDVTRAALAVYREIGADDDRSFGNVLEQVWLVPATDAAGKP
ncbi:MAG: hypothetical protein AB8F26_05290 [Phycisphaerales bacterium]